MSELLRGWRKLAGSSWRAPEDPQYFGDLDTDAAAVRYYRADPGALDMSTVD